ncbi:MULTISPECIES: CCA tRNA nucleotidyltransferase [Clostridium]|uniref:CCA tRNA nucleotidyltransferase n=1 Tax=Clostridium cadaveris TaxID=1529 RepID=A0A1I2PUL4_9CLOT|nr:CCA tRNA nucleotidyltransferase [Clostridium cadaveris]MDU4953329.1 CCA tRNA nucleotidyltransferase [Clostridium sp.]PWL52111.1 MAG: CCA tRNA nucleotidyltransferase [Clostridium cadaveris]UFH65026.1 CCA tRNA nucleotidyltransferase [Clostridium cadaveris]SFG18809.1 tRNA nucleotidyltransferase (CCA-adding enzyme) [Clostridium cadaveris]
MNIFIPQKVKFILDTLISNGFDAYIVGGCVRDSILNKIPNDYDVTTNAFPDDIMRLFDKIIPTGISHGTVTVLIDKEPFEVTTFRTESDYLDNRHPSKVFFVKDVKEDLSRRDFTINSMAYNTKYGLVDPFNGVKDLNLKIIRCVGDSSLRFKEDALRMLRAIRFSSQLDFQIDNNTLSAISENKDLLKNISAERIRDELIKMLLSDKAFIAINHMINTKTLKVILPELYEILLTNKSLNNIDLLPNKLYIRLCYLMIPLENFKLCKGLLKHLRFDNNTINLTMKFYDAIFKNFNLQDRVSIKNLIYNISKNNIFDFLSLLKIIYINDFDHIKLIENAQLQVEDIISNKEPLSIKDLKINGNDLKELGIKDGRIIGSILNFLLENVLRNPEINTKNHLLKLSNQYINKSPVS